MADSAAPSAGRVFISYRREETAYAAGWLFDRLADRFGRGQIFKDIDSIQLGDDFVEVITTAVGSCDVLLALIGEQWLTITDEQGTARLDNPDDFVRLEIEAALTRNVRVIPILVAGARMPRPDQLPPSLAKLVRRHALELSPSHFEFDTSRLHRRAGQQPSPMCTPSRRSPNPTSRSLPGKRGCARSTSRRVPRCGSDTSRPRSTCSMTCSLSIQAIETRHSCGRPPANSFTSPTPTSGPSTLKPPANGPTRRTPTPRFWTSTQPTAMPPPAARRARPGSSCSTCKASYATTPPQASGRPSSTSMRSSAASTRPRPTPTGSPPKHSTSLDDERRADELAHRYTRARDAEDARDWAAAASEYAEILQLDPKYRDAIARQDNCVRQQRISEVRSQLDRQVAAEEWAKVRETFDQLTALDPALAVNYAEFADRARRAPSAPRVPKRRWVLIAAATGGGGRCWRNRHPRAGARTRPRDRRGSRRPGMDRHPRRLPDRQAARGHSHRHRPRQQVSGAVGPYGDSNPDLLQFNVPGLPNVNHAALIGSVDRKQPFFVVGKKATLQCLSAGRLFLGINDIDVTNNSGKFTATIKQR